MVVAPPTNVVGSLACAATSTMSLHLEGQHRDPASPATWSRSTSATASPRRCSSASTATSWSKTIDRVQRDRVLDPVLRDGSDRTTAGPRNPHSTGSLPVLTALVVDAHPTPAAASPASSASAAGRSSRPPTPPTRSAPRRLRRPRPRRHRRHDARPERPALLRRLRATGSRARFLVVTPTPTDDVRAEAPPPARWPAWPSRSTPRILLDFLRRRTTGPTAQDPSPRSTTWTTSTRTTWTPS